jgi:ORF6N domain
MQEQALAIRVEWRIYQIRGEKVMLASDLAELYGVSTSALNQAVRRNQVRFPSDFMFQLNAQEWNSLKSQNVISKRGGVRRARPYAFTEQGVAMLSSVLTSDRAAAVNVAIMRTFVRLREMLLSNADLARKLNALEQKYDAQSKVVFDAIRELMTPPASPKRRIGFHP